MTATQRRRNELRDDSVKSPAERTERINLGLTLFSLFAMPGVRYTLDEIAAWAGTTPDAILLIERKALMKVRKKLECRPDLRDELREFFERRAA